MALDKIDRKILSLLQGQARMTNQALAEQVNLSPSSCLNRVKKLEAEGLIGPYLSVLNVDKICRTVTAIATVKLLDQSTEAFALFQQQAYQVPELVECFTVSGGFDMFLRIVAPDMNRYNEITNYLLDILPGKVNLSSHIVLSTDKPYRGVPLEVLLEE